MEENSLHLQFKIFDEKVEENIKEKKSRKGLKIIIFLGILLVGTLLVLNSQEISVYDIISNNLLGLVSAQVEESNPEITRTRSTETTCNNGTCNLILYSGIRFVEEDKQWKKVEDAKSLKNKGFNIVYLKDDGTHKIDVVDFNMTSIELKFSYDKTNLGEFESEVEDGKMKTKFKIIETLFNETTGEFYDIETEQEIEIEEDGQNNIIYSRNPFGKRFKLGENSTTIILQDADTENLEDSFVSSGSGADINSGTSDRLYVTDQDINFRRAYIKFNISAIPSEQQINNATWNGFKWHISGPSSTASLHHVFNQTWDETQITYNNQPCDTGFDNSAECNLTEESSVVGSVGWEVFTATESVSTAYSNGDSNVSFIIKSQEIDSSSTIHRQIYHSKEYTADTSLRPYLNITYSEIPAPVVNLDNPTNNTFSNVLNQSFNTTYSAIAGDLVNATLNIWNSTDLVFNETASVTGTSNISNISFVFTTDDEYFWNYEVCDDSVLCAFNSTNFTITIDTTPPTFDNLADQNADANTTFTFDIDATDVTSSVDCFTVNDTTNFQIDCDGVLQNNTVLLVQVYPLNISVNDSANNTAYGIMNVNVTVFDTILKWDWAALMTDLVSPDRICFIFRDSEEYCIDKITAKNIFVPQYIFPHSDKTIPLTTADVWENITFDQETTAIKSGISHTFNDNTNQTFTINQDGIYNIQYDFDVVDTSPSASDIDSAGRVIFINGTEILGSAFETDITKQQIETQLSHSFLARLNAGDKIVFQFIADDVDVAISTHGTFGDHPDSVTIIIEKVANL